MGSEVSAVSRSERNRVSSSDSARPRADSSRQLLALLGAGRALQRLAGRVLLGAQLLELGGDCPPLLVELQDAVDRLHGRAGAAPGQRRPHGVRVAADQPDVENGRRLRYGHWLPAGRVPIGFCSQVATPVSRGAWRPA